MNCKHRSMKKNIPKKKDTSRHIIINCSKKKMSKQPEKRKTLYIEEPR